MPRIPENVLTEIRERADIVDIIGSYISLKRAGTNFKAPCPFHSENTPSFVVSPGKQIYHCFGCHVGGNVYTFIRDYERVSFLEAVKKVADQIGYTLDFSKFSGETAAENNLDRFIEVNNIATLFYQRSLTQSADTKSYLERRQVPAEMIERFQIGYAPDEWSAFSDQLDATQQKAALEIGLSIQKRSLIDRFRHRLMFPIHDSSGRIIGFGGRQLRDEDNPKYMNSPESPVYHKSRVLYGIHQALTDIRKQRSALLVEGYMDVIRCHQYGFTTAVATSGTALTADQARILKRFCDTVYFCYDSDNAGIQSMIRSIPILLGRNLEVRVVPLPVGHDPDTILQEFGAERFQHYIRLAADYLDFQFRYFSKSGDLKSTRRKAEIIHTIQEQIQQIVDPVHRELELKRLKEYFNIETLSITSKRQSKLEEPSSEFEAELKLIHAPEYRKEQLLLRSIVQLPSDELSSMMRKIRPEQFRNVALQSISRHLLDMVDIEGQIPEDPEYIHDPLTRIFVRESATQSDTIAFPIADLLIDVEIDALRQQISDESKRPNADLERIQQWQQKVHELDEQRRSG